MQKKDNLIRVYGAGGHSSVVIDVLRENGLQVSEIYDDGPNNTVELSEEITEGVRSSINDFPHKGPPMIIAIGNNRKRAEIESFINCDFAKVVHNRAIVAKNVHIGAGTVVFAGAVIQPNTIIGKHSIVNTSASIDHHCTIGDFTHISPNATLCGNVSVMEGTQIGSAAVIIPNVTVGKWCVIGAGAVVIKDIPDYCTVVGNPGRIIKQKQIDKRNKR